MIFLLILRNKEDGKPRKKFTFAKNYYNKRYENVFFGRIYGSGQDNGGKRACRARRSFVHRFQITISKEGVIIKAVSRCDIRRERGGGFREIERNMLHEVAEFEDVLISTGGAPCSITWVYERFWHDGLPECQSSWRSVWVDKHTRPVLKGRSGEELRAFPAEVWRRKGIRFIRGRPQRLMTRRC